jgi:lysine 6-dehydrogenase
LGDGKVVLLGSGLMGSSIALDLLDSSDVTKLTVLDSDSEKLKALKFRASRKNRPRVEGGPSSSTAKLETVELDFRRHPEDAIRIMGDADLGIGALPHGLAEQAVMASLEAKVDFVDLIYSWRYEKGDGINEKARQNGNTIIPACGLAPGLTNILAKYAADQMEEVDSVKIKVGGIPESPKGPLGYKIVFAIDSVLEEYIRDALVIRKGKRVMLPALSEIEELSFPDLPEGKFEAFITDGLSTLPESMKNVREMEEKTIRWQGHADQIKLLIDLGFFSERPVSLKQSSSSRVAPRALLSTLLEKKLAMHQGDKDMTLLRVEVKGRKRKGDSATRVHQYEMVDKFDPDTQTTSMARTTAYPCSAVAQMLLEDKITEKGFLPPELAIRDERFDDFLSRLDRKGLTIKENEFLAPVS